MLNVILDVRECDGHVIVALRGELDLADAADVAAALMAAAAGRGSIIVDLAGLAFIDCSGAAALARAQRRVRRDGGSLLLAAPRPRVLRVFQLSRLIDPDSVCPSLALAASVCEVSGIAGLTSERRWPVRRTRTGDWPERRRAGAQ